MQNALDKSTTRRVKAMRKGAIVADSMTMDGGPGVGDRIRVGDENRYRVGRIKFQCRSVFHQDDNPIVDTSEEPRSFHFRVIDFPSW